MKRRTVVMDDLTAYAQQILARQPFSRLLGATIEGIGPNRASLRLPFTETLTQQHGQLHGGVISYLADNALTFAGGIALGGDAVTSEFKINFVRPARGTALVARAHAISIGKRQAVCRCEVFFVDGTDETLCAAAQGTVIGLGVAHRSEEHSTDSPARDDGRMEKR